MNQDDREQKRVIRFAGVVLWIREMVLLQRRSPDAELLRGMWGVFGGHIESTEIPEETAIREIEEELAVWLARDDLQELGRTEFDRPDAVYITDYFAALLPVGLDQLSLREGVGFSLWTESESASLPMAPEDMLAVQRHFGSRLRGRSGLSPGTVE